MTHDLRLPPFACRRGLIVALLLSAPQLGCATHAEAFGERARYSPAFRSYVLGPYDGSHDPPAGEMVVILRDPLTGEKLTCAEAVAPVRALFEDVAADQLHDERVAIGVGVGLGIALSPSAALQPLGAATIFYGAYGANHLFDGLASDDAEELVAAGLALQERKRHADAERLFVAALARDPVIGWVDKTYLYLGRAYVALGKEDEARLALSLFVSRAAVRDAEAYDEAEALLDDLDVARESCASREPIPVYW